MKTAFIVTVIALLLLAACGNNTIDAQTTLPTDKVKVGVILPLTGSSANLGIGIQKGIEIAKQEINNLDIIYEDDAGNTKNAITSFNKLADVDKARIVILGLSGSTLGIAPLAEEKKIILMAPIASAEKISDAGDYTFRIREVSTFHGRKMAEYAISRGWKKAAISSLNADSSLTYVKGFIQRYGELGGQITAKELYEKDEADVRTQMGKIKAANPEVIFFAGLTDDTARAMKTARELGVKQPFLAHPGIEDGNTFFKVAGNSAEGTIYSSPFDDRTAQAQEFKRLYAQKYNEAAFPWFATNSYDALKLISKVVEKCGENTDCIKKELYATQNYVGASGTFSFDAKGDVQRPLILMKVENQAFKRLV